MLVYIVVSKSKVDKYNSRFLYWQTTEVEGHLDRGQICLNRWKKVTHVAETKVEKNQIFCRSVIIYSGTVNVIFSQ